MTFFTDPSFGPVLTFATVSFIVSAIVTIVYKYTTNQRMMKQLRDDLKKYQEQLRSTKDTTKLLSIQKKAMDVNMKYMMQSMRPTFFTLLPVLMIFGWVAANLSAQQITPGQEFTITAQLESGDASLINISTPNKITLLSSASQGNTANFTLNGEAGRHPLVLTYNTETVEKPVLITTSWDFTKPTIKKPGLLGGLFTGELFEKSSDKLPQSSTFAAISTRHEPVRPFGGFSIFGYKPGWVMTYILFSLVFSIALRKLMNLS